MTLVEIYFHGQRPLSQGGHTIIASYFIFYSFKQIIYLFNEQVIYLICLIDSMVQIIT